MATLAPAAPLRARNGRDTVAAGAVFGFLLAAVAALNLSLGAVSVAPDDVVRALFDPERADPAAALVVREIRLPRLLAALAVGAALAAAGAALQALFRNPLADPGLLGVSTGSALGAALWFVAGGTLAAAAAPALKPFLLPGASFAGALGAIGVVLALAARSGPGATLLMLLLGIGVNALGGACIGLLSYISTDTELRSLSVWLLGTLAQVERPVLLVALAIVGAGLAGLLATARELDLLALGEEAARHLGLDVDALRQRVALLTALCVGAAVALAGLVGFLGLVVPHVVRLWLGPGHRRLLPMAALGGAAFLALADLAARLIALPAEVPVGIVMAFAGAPPFLWVLRSAWRRVAA
ncbi:MAG: iron ABC transporter permease [Sphingomonadaceae bacterium]|uniref:FecCD family ABC transporter permease n=1 Tax=Thermaurantiacus sp. TaxID=2820283 RepID=UPI00298ED236|nr:iron ABC transporter permease [Thermaurantiacus sp.]MCS6986286.1 iron ABC transporter permease [Sphingomonadaceae bacterium]MDW8415735.1 iron ABC transporter permease [Thermaurantiacus sp.]